MASKACDRTFQYCGTSGSFAHLLSDFRSQPRILRLTHQSQLVASARIIGLLLGSAFRHIYEKATIRPGSQGDATGQGSGCQFKMSLIGAADSSTCWYMSNRPSRETTDCCLLPGPPGASRAGNSAVGVRAANVAPVLVIGAAISLPSGAMK